METALKWFDLGKATPSSSLMTGNKEAVAEKAVQAESEAHA